MPVLLYRATGPPLDRCGAARAHAAGKGTGDRSLHGIQSDRRENGGTEICFQGPLPLDSYLHSSGRGECDGDFPFIRVCTYMRAHSQYVMKLFLSLSFSLSLPSSLAILPCFVRVGQVAKRVEGRLSIEAKEEQKRAFEALGDDEEQAPPPKLKKISTTQVALNYVR